MRAGGRPYSGSGSARGSVKVFIHGHRSVSGDRFPNLLGVGFTGVRCPSVGRQPSTPLFPGPRHICRKGGVSRCRLYERVKTDQRGP